MNKCLMAILVVIGLTSCMKKDEAYYQTHPNELQQAIKSCPKQQSQGMTCNQLQELARRMNQLAYQLQQNPQGFGNKILMLQDAIGRQEQQLKTDIGNKELQEEIARNQHDLAEYLAVVKWLESPTS